MGHKGPIVKDSSYPFTLLTYVTLYIRYPHFKSLWGRHLTGDEQRTI